MEGFFESSMAGAVSTREPGRAVSTLDYLGVYATKGYRIKVLLVRESCYLGV